MKKGKKQTKFIEAPAEAKSAPSEFELISIENFSRESKNVYFTEKATIEAIKRLGYTTSDLNYRPMCNFKRPGCDESVTKLLFNKYETKRQKIISEISEMRNKILDENTKNETSKIQIENSPLLRLEMAQIEKEKSNLSNVQRQREVDLKRIVIAQFRDFFMHQKNLEALQKTLEKTEKITQMKLQTLNAAKLKSLKPPDKSPQAITLPPMKPVYIDPHIERVKKMKDDMAKKREEKRLKYEQHIKDTHDKFIERQEQKREKELKKISEDEDRFKRWQENQILLAQEKNKKFANRHLHDLAVCQNGLKMEEEARNRALKKMHQRELRSKVQIELVKNALKAHLETVKNRIDERSKRVHEELDKQKLEVDLFRKKLDQKDSEVEQKRKKLALDTTLKYLERQIDRDEKAENAKRIGVRKAYMAEVAMKQHYEDVHAVSKLSVEKQKIINGRHLVDSKFQAKKEQLLAEFRAAGNPNDPRFKKRIAELLQIDICEIDELINAAKSSLIEYSRPSTACISDLHSKRTMSSISYRTDSASDGL